MWMKHPTLPDAEPAEVQTESFLGVWRHRGWVEADPPAVEEFKPAQAEPSKADAGPALSKKREEK